MWYKTDGENVYKLLREESEFVWIIDVSGQTGPFRAAKNVWTLWDDAPFPTENTTTLLTASKKQKAVMQTRKKVILPLLDCKEAIHTKDVARKNGLSERTVLRYLYAYLAKGDAGLLPAKYVRKKQTDDDANRAIMAKALKKYYYSANRMSLSMAYEMMLLESFRADDGHMRDDRPTFAQFRYFYESTKDEKKKIIGRKGIGSYRKDFRMLTGAGDSNVERIGTYEMDATQADIYLVSEYNREVIGRPYIYLAVDVVSRLIAGVYVGMDASAESVLLCLANAAEDKVAFCAQYGVTAEENSWPSCNLPGHIWTDRGQDFIGMRVKELCEIFGVEIVNLPAFRPDLKGYVENAFNCIQSRYKPILHGKGVIEQNAMGIGANYYVKQACLTLKEFTAVVIRCILYYNSHHLIEGVRRPEFSQDGGKPIAAQMWCWYKEHELSDMIPVDSMAVRLLFLPRQNAAITRYGIRVGPVHYMCEDMSILSDKFEVAYDPNDISVAYGLTSAGVVPLKLTKASEPYRKLSCFEMQKLMESERNLKRTLEEQELVGRVDCDGAIQAIADKHTRKK